MKFLLNKKIYYIIAISAILFLPSITIAADSASFKLKITPAPQCYDGVDNDGDGKIDYPNDPGCSSPNDDDESNPVVTPTPGGGGGGGGGSSGNVKYIEIEPITSASFSGKAYPNKVVKLLKDGQVVASSIAGSDATFQINLQGLSAGNYTFSLYSEDSLNRRSTLTSLSLTVSKGSIVQFSNVIIPPSLDVDKVTYKPGESVIISGETVPMSDVEISVHSNQEKVFRTKSNKYGLYSYKLDSSELGQGEHSVRSRTVFSSGDSDYNSAVFFAVGEVSIVDSKNNLTGKCRKADFNCDGFVNLVDFSIAAYWYKKPVNSAAAMRIDLNNDKKIDLIDFSIIAYYWTG